ncbi:glycoside hydrolase family 97 protein [Tundrisphaera sp. TA3]|uniref:glycoside hydrolase family 97 protein n=1 Tax=Tundrisphaera sp. TA3 TaxID=3435775 RepID=UPI003EBA0F70
MGRQSWTMTWAFGLLAAGAALADGPVEVASPGGEIRAAISLDGAEPRYAVTYRGRPVALPSRLGVDLGDGSSLGAGSRIEGVRSRRVDESYRQFPGKRSRVVDRYAESVISFREAKGPARRWELVVRASDDGVAFRYRFPAQEGWSKLEIAAERTGFRPPDDARSVAMPVPSFLISHEGLYQQGPAAGLPRGGLIGLPLLVELPGTGWAAFLEADWQDYAGLYLARDDGPGASLAARLSPLPGEPGLAVRADLPHESPWRAILIGDRVERLVESDLALNLNDPCAIADTSWIKPGKTTFPWWNGFYEEPGQIPQRLDTATAKYYIDFCARAGIPYHSLDGIDETAWYGGPLKPWKGADISRGKEGLDLAEIVRYGKSKGVGIRLWLNWAGADAMMDRAFPIYRELGVEGVMVDLIDRDDQAISRFVRRLAATAASNHLTVTIHNIKEPTGLERTYPNLLAFEAVRNLEFDKWDPIGVPPEHETTIPFTRMLAGPLDFHQGSFRVVSLADYRPRDKAPNVIGTTCRMLASYVVYQDHLSMVADYPSAYRDQPALPLLVAIPSTWDETRCLEGKVGELAVVARKHGDEWWVGALGGREARDVAIPLNFLDAGRDYVSETHRDMPGEIRGFESESVRIRSDATIRARLEPAGGLLIRLKPLADR